MELLALWLASCIASFGMEISNGLKLFKDVADAGYKIDINRFSEVQKQLSPNASKNSLITLMIPVYNLLKAFETRIKYNNVRPMVLDSLHVIDALEEMTEQEKEEYKKHPTGLNALIVPIKTEIRLSKAAKIKVDDGEIFYEFNLDKNNKSDNLSDYITIVKATGNFKGSSDRELKQKIVSAWKEISTEGIKMYGSEENFLEEIKKAYNNNESIEINKDNDEKNDIVQEPNSTLSTSQKIQALKDLKQELEEEKRANQNEEQEKENGSSYKKTRK